MKKVPGSDIGDLQRGEREGAAALSLERRGPGGPPGPPAESMPLFPGGYPPHRKAFKGEVVVETQKPSEVEPQAVSGGLSTFGHGNAALHLAKGVPKLGK